MRRTGADLDFTFKDLFDEEDTVTIPAPSGAHMHTCPFCGCSRAECASQRKKNESPLKSALLNYIAHVHVSNNIYCGS